MTIYDIAKQAGVSASTVSRVINNKPGINAQTRKRVQKLLNENHYTHRWHNRIQIPWMEHLYPLHSPNLKSDTCRQKLSGTQ